MSLNFIDGKNTLQVSMLNQNFCTEKHLIDGIRLHVSDDYDTIIFDLSRDDVVILMRHLNAYIENGELMRV